MKKFNMFRAHRTRGALGARRALASVLSVVVCVLIAVPTAAQEQWPALSETAWLEMTVFEVQELLESNRVDARDEEGTTALFYAIAMSADTAVAEALIEAGANVNVRIGPNNLSPLAFASMYRRDGELVQALVDAGANLEARDEYGQTPLILAAEHNRDVEIIFFWFQLAPTERLFRWETTLAQSPEWVDLEGSVRQAPDSTLLFPARYTEWRCSRLACGLSSTSGAATLLHRLSPVDPWRVASCA